MSTAKFITCIQFKKYTLYCIFISVSSMSYRESMKINATVNILGWNCWSVSFTNTIKPFVGMILTNSAKKNGGTLTITFGDLLVLLIIVLTASVRRWRNSKWGHCLFAFIYSVQFVLYYVIQWYFDYINNWDN